MLFHNSFYNVTVCFEFDKVSISVSSRSSAISTYTQSYFFATLLPPLSPSSDKSCGISDEPDVDATLGEFGSKSLNAENQSTFDIASGSDYVLIATGWQFETSPV